MSGFHPARQQMADRVNNVKMRLKKNFMTSTSEEQQHQGDMTETIQGGSEEPTYTVPLTAEELIVLRKSTIGKVTPKTINLNSALLKIDKEIVRAAMTQGISGPSPQDMDSVNA